MEIRRLGDLGPRFELRRLRRPGRRGQIRPCFRGQPDRTDTRHHHDEHRTLLKAMAKDKGAVGLIYIYPRPFPTPMASGRRISSRP